MINSSNENYGVWSFYQFCLEVLEKDGSREVKFVTIGTRKALKDIYKWRMNSTRATQQYGPNGV